MRLKDKVAIITGAAQGIGEASAFEFAKQGAKVVVADIQEGKGKAVVEKIRSNGGEAAFAYVDMSNPDSFDGVLETAVKTFGHLDILFNNAGISYSAPLEELNMDKWDAIMRINLRGPFVMIKKAMPYLLETKGNILNTCSFSALRAQTTGYAYNSSKAALLRMSEIVAIDYAKKGIRVNTICPGVTDTEILKTCENLWDWLKTTIPMGRFGRPEEIAKVAAFIVSDDASYMTGAAISVDGGQIAQ